MLYFFNHFIQLWLLPPGFLIILLILTFLFLSSRPKAAKFLIMFIFMFFWAFSTPLVAQLMIKPLQTYYPALQISHIKQYEQAAIVVLDAGLNLLTPEYGQPMVAKTTLPRLQYAAYLHQQTHIPIMVSGYDPIHSATEDAEVMADVLARFYGVAVRWKENKGANTAQEGLFCTRILAKEGIKSIYLVTEALHIPRAMQAFANSGMTIIAAPTAYRNVTSNLGAISHFLPDIESLHTSTDALHEYIGITWYWLLNNFS